ncbi:hypothetical protein [Desulfomicrobium baculatum]|uniref:Uncharacterized protein n=1 Tax=Desulfomicrobium baculatum (strain DSM 4028 / VKM B-1378 / X) TaxID=525897 RepID=C7LRV4_DESBD|nr:hypothetical protein [Desulfomicrobium baculatum]ACU89337.1 hypothetical protein Dbac_1234 [Desulfomicrobium baculatum DSM 4028]
MINTRGVMRSLLLVASVLGRKYRVKVEMGRADAFTDGKTIHLPALPSKVPDTLLKASVECGAKKQGMSVTSISMPCRKPDSPTT